MVALRERRKGCYFRDQDKISPVTRNPGRGVRACRSFAETVQTDRPAPLFDSQAADPSRMQGAQRRRLGITLSHASFGSTVEGKLHAPNPQSLSRRTNGATLTEGDLEYGNVALPMIPLQYWSYFIHSIFVADLRRGMNASQRQ